MIENRQDALARLVFGLLLLAVFGHIWFASTPLPFGGPNVVFAVAAAALSVVLWIWQSVPLARVAGVGHAIVAGFLARFRPAAPALLVALCMWGWVLAVYLRSDTFNLARFGQLTAGVGVLFALLCVLCARRARLLIGAVVIATSLSALFGIGVLVIGEPFLGAWLRIASVAEKDLDTILLGGRTAGLAAHPSALGYQLAVAIVFAFALLVLGAPWRHALWRRLVDAALLLLLTAMLTALLVNASRSTGLGVAVGVGLCLVGAATGSFPRRGALRLLVVGLLVTLTLTAVFNPWRNVGDWVDELHPMREGAGDIVDLASGGEALASNDPQLIGHRFEGYKPGARYDVRLRERYRMGMSWRNSLIATADADGGIVLTWRRAPHRGVVRYEFRVREIGSRRFKERFQRFAPALRSRGATLAVDGLTVGDSALAADDDAVVWTDLTDLVPAGRYDLQLRAVLPAEQGPPSQTSGPADDDGRLVFAWRRALLPQVTYQYRLRQSSNAPWSAWRQCTAFLPRLPVWPELREGSETLGMAAPGHERVGHTFAGLRPWRWYKAQVSETLADGVDRAPRHGELVVEARPASYFVFTWPAPRVPEGVAGYKFRVRDVARRWLPWRDFTPSLSNRTPVPSTLSAGWSVVEDDRLIRHTLRGLPPGTRQLAQLRARGVHGFGGESVAVEGVTGGDGSFVLAWRELPRAKITGYQYRLWWKASEQWRPWRDLVPRFDRGNTRANLTGGGHSRERTLAVARNAQGVAGALRLQPRLFDAGNFSARSRLWQVAAAWRYALDHPFGTGEYQPLPSHVGEDVSEAMLEETLREPPHNQFLHVLVLYGFPGLCLLVLFYALLTRAAWRAGKLAWRERDAQLRFLVVAVVAAWAAYSVNSFWVPTGPFLQEWDHYFVLGLLLSLESIVAKGSTGRQ